MNACCLYLHWGLTILIRDPLMIPHCCCSYLNISSGRTQASSIWVTLCLAVLIPQMGQLSFSVLLFALLHLTGYKRFNWGHSLQMQYKVCLFVVRHVSVDCSLTCSLTSICFKFKCESRDKDEQTCWWASPHPLKWKCATSQVTCSLLMEMCDTSDCLPSQSPVEPW